MTEPCHTTRDARRVDDYCDQCGHALVVHKADLVCVLCEALEELRRRETT